MLVSGKEKKKRYSVSLWKMLKKKERKHPAILSAFNINKHHPKTIPIIHPFL